MGARWAINAAVPKETETKHKHINSVTRVGEGRGVESRMTYATPKHPRNIPETSHQHSRNTTKITTGTFKNHTRNIPETLNTHIRNTPETQ